LAAIFGGLQDPLEKREGHLGATRGVAGDVREQVLDERPADPLHREVVERRGVAEAVLGDANGLRPRPHATCGADHEAVEPCLRELPEALGWRLVEDAGLARALDVELEGLRVSVNGEGARAVAPCGVPVANLVAPLAFRRPV
jgi:hypothetical protein